MDLSLLSKPALPLNSTGCYKREQAGLLHAARWHSGRRRDIPGLEPKHPNTGEPQCGRVWQSVAELSVALDLASLNCD